MRDDDETTARQRPALPSWGEAARVVFFIAVSVNIVLSIVRLAISGGDTVGDWNPLRFVVAGVILVSAAAWAAAELIVRRRA